MDVLTIFTIMIKLYATNLDNLFKRNTFYPKVYYTPKTENYAWVKSYFISL